MKVIGRGLVAMVLAFLGAIAGLVAGSPVSQAALDNQMSLVDGGGR
ncbi:MAG: Porin, partial [Actinomycetota bacterium]|nr:Porin [Actinomycetota bacterium]